MLDKTLKCEYRYSPTESMPTDVVVSKLKTELKKMEPSFDYVDCTITRLKLKKTEKRNQIRTYNDEIQVEVSDPYGDVEHLPSFIEIRKVKISLLKKEIENLEAIIGVLTSYCGRLKLEKPNASV